MMQINKLRVLISIHSLMFASSNVPCSAFYRFSLNFLRNLFWYFSSIASNSSVSLDLCLLFSFFLFLIFLMISFSSCVTNYLVLLSFFLFILSSLFLSMLCTFSFADGFCGSCSGWWVPSSRAMRFLILCFLPLLLESLISLCRYSMSVILSIDCFYSLSCLITFFCPRSTIALV